MLFQELQLLFSLYCYLWGTIPSKSCFLEELCQVLLLLSCRCFTWKVQGSQCTGVDPPLWPIIQRRSSRFLNKDPILASSLENEPYSRLRFKYWRAQLDFTASDSAKATESPPQKFLLRSKKSNTELDLILVAKAVAPTPLIELFGRLKCVNVLLNWSAFPSAVAPESEIRSKSMLRWVNVRFVSRNSASSWVPPSPIKTWDDLTEKGLPIKFWYRKTGSTECDLDSNGHDS